MHYACMHTDIDIIKYVSHDMFGATNFRFGNLTIKNI